MMTTPRMSLVTMTREVNTSHGMMNGSRVGGETMEEQFWFQSVYLGYLWTALIIGLPGNILIAVVYMTVQQKRTSDWFIFFLSVYDCAVCVFAVPLYLSIETGVWMATGSDLACKIEQFTIFTAQFSSVSILGIIAVDRYLKICLPTRRSLNATQARNIGICTPFISALVAAPVLVWDGNVEHKFCRLQERYKNTLGVKIHRCSTFGFFVCVFFVVIFCYAHVCIVVRRRIQRHRENVMKRKHLMQIPAFLQAISNVDDPTGHASGRVHRSKRKFSLFSLGSSRRLSAITPWVKARLSLPSESVARNMGLPLDEVELESKESLAESKKKLDQALKLRGQAGSRSLNYKEKKELFKEHIEKLKDRKRAEKERNERQEVIEELSGNEDSDKQIKDDMRTLDKIFSTSEFTLANCSTHSGVIQQWRNIFSSPGTRQTPRPRQYAAEISGMSVESKLSDIRCDANQSEPDSNVNIDSNCPNTCIVSVQLENVSKTAAVLAEVSADSSNVVQVKDGNDCCEQENDAKSIVSSSDISIHIQQDQGDNRSNDETTVHLCNKKNFIEEQNNVLPYNNLIPEIPAYGHRHIPLLHGTEHRYQCPPIPLQTQHPESNDCCQHISAPVSLNQSKQKSETQAMAENSCFSSRDKLDLRRSCGSVPYRFNSWEHELGHELGHERELVHDSRSTFMKPSHSLKHLPYSNSPMGSHCRLQHASGSETNVSQKTSKLDLDSGHFCNKIPVDPDIGALYSRGKRKFDYPCLRERGIDPTGRNSVISKCSRKTRHITEGLVLACELNPMDLVKSMGKSSSKSPASRPCCPMRGFDLDDPVVEDFDKIWNCEGSKRCSDVGELDQNEANEDDCTEALLGSREGSVKCEGEKSSSSNRASTKWKTTSLGRTCSRCDDSCTSLERCEIKQALLSEPKSTTDKKIFRGQGRCSSYEHLNESYSTGSYERIRYYVKNLAKGRVSSECPQNSQTGSNARRLKHQEAVEEYFENTPENNTELNDTQLKVQKDCEATHGDVRRLSLLGQSAGSSIQQIRSDTRNGNTTFGVSTEVLGKQNFEKFANQISGSTNMPSQQHSSIASSSNEGSSTDHQRTINYSTQSLSRPGNIDRVYDDSDVTNDRRVCLRSKSYDTATRQPRSDIAYAIQHSIEQPLISPRGAVPQSHLKNIGIEATRNNIDGAIWGSGSRFYRERESIESEILRPLMNSSNHEFHPRHLTEDIEKVCHVSESLVENIGSSNFRITSLFNSTASVQECVNTRTLSDYHVNGRDTGLSQSSSPIVTEGNKKNEPLYPAPRSESTSLAREPTRYDTKRELTNQRDLDITLPDRDFNSRHHVNTSDLVNTEQLYTADLVNTEQLHVNSRNKVLTGQIEWGRKIGSSRPGIQTIDPLCRDISLPNSPRKDGARPEKQDNKMMLNRCHTKHHGCLQHPLDVGCHECAADKQKGFQTDPTINSTVDCLVDLRDNSLKSRPDFVIGCAIRRMCACSRVVCPLPENDPCLTNSIIKNETLNPYPMSDLDSCLQGSACQSPVSEVNTVQGSAFETSVSEVNTVQGSTFQSSVSEFNTVQGSTFQSSVSEFNTVIDGGCLSSFSAMNSHLENSGHMTSESGIIDGRCDDFMKGNVFIPECFSLFTRARDSMYCPNCQYNEQAPLSLAQYNDIYVHSSRHFRCDDFLEDDFHQHHVYRGLISSFIETSSTNVLHVLLEYPDFDENTFLFSSKETRRCYNYKSDASSFGAKISYHEKYDCTSRAEKHVSRFESSEDEGQNGTKFLTFVSQYTFPGQIRCDICLVQILQNSIYGHENLQVGQENQVEAGQSESQSNIIGLSNKNVAYIVSKRSTNSPLKSCGQLQMITTRSQPLSIYDMVNSRTSLTIPLPHLNCFILQFIDKYSDVGNKLDLIRSSATLTAPPLHQGVSEPPLHQCVFEKPFHQCVSEPPCHQCVSEQPCHQCVSEPPFHQRVSKPPFHQCVSEPPCHQCVSEQPFHQCVSEPPFHQCVSDPPFHECVNFLHCLFQRNPTYCTHALCTAKCQNSIFKSIQIRYSNMQNNVLASFTYLDFGQSELMDWRHDLFKTTLLNIVCLRCFHMTSSIQVQHTHYSDKDGVCKCVQAQSRHKLPEPLSRFVNGNASKSRQVVSEKFSVPDNGACADRSCQGVVDQRESLTPSIDSGNRTPPSPHDATCVHRRNIGFRSDGSPGKLRWVVPGVIDASSHETQCLDGGHLEHLKKVKSLGDLRLFDYRADSRVSHETMGRFHKQFISMNSISQLCTSPSYVAKKHLHKEETGKRNGDLHAKMSGNESEKLRFVRHKNRDSPVRTDNRSLPLSINSDQIRGGISINEETNSFPTSLKTCLENGISLESLEGLDAKKIIVNSENQCSERLDAIENSATENGAYSSETSFRSLVSRDDVTGQRLHGSLSGSSTRKAVPECESEPASESDIPAINDNNCESVCLLGGTLAPLASHFNKFAKVINVGQCPPTSLTIQSKQTNTENAMSSSVPPPRPSELGGLLCDLRTQVNTTNAIHSTLLKCLPTYSVTPALKPTDLNKPNNETCAFFVKSVFDAFFTMSGKSSSSEPCLNTAREDEEVYEFPLFPLSSGHLDTPDLSKRKGTAYNIPEASRLSSGNRSPWKNSSRSSGISHSWYSLNDLEPTNKPTLLRNSRCMYLTAIRRQLNNVFSPRGIRQFFGISDSPTMKKSGNKTFHRDRLSTNHINVIITRCESLVMDKSEDELPPMRSRAVTLDPTCMDKGTRSSNDSVYYYNNNNGAGPRCESVTTPKPRASSLDTTHSSVSRSDDQSLHSRSQDTSFDRSRGCSLDLLSPASASLRTGSMCSGMSSMSRLTECSAYTEHSRSDCEKITRRTAEREHNITRLLGVITMIFVISWSVSWAVILYNTLSLEPVADSSHVMLSLPRDMFLINHFCNIIVYTILSRSFRDKLSQCYSSVKMC